MKIGFVKLATAKSMKIGELVYQIATGVTAKFLILPFRNLE